MKRILCVLVLLSALFGFSNMSLAQSGAYVKSFRKLMDMGIMNNAEMFRTGQMKTAMTQAVEMAGVNSEAAGALVDKYLRKQFVTDISVCMAKYFEPSLKVETIEGVVDELKNPELKSAYLHAISANMKANEEWQTFGSKYVQAISSGKKAPAIMKSSQVTTKYLETVKQLNKITDVRKATAEAMEGMTSSMKKMVPTKDQAAFESIVKSMVDYVIDNFDVVMANTFVKTMSQRELDIYTQAMSKPIWQEYNKQSAAGLKNMMMNIMPFSQDYMMRFVQWCQAQE